MFRCFKKFMLLTFPIATTMMATTTVSLLPSTVKAWGGRGHDTICQSAVHLVENEELKSFLMSRPHIMGHLCNVPDIHWKSQPKSITSIGNTTHYVNTEYFNNTPISKISLNLDELEKNHEKNGSKDSLYMQMGTNWWRANQFFELALEAAKKAKTATPPKNHMEQQDDSMDYNKAIYAMIVNMGIMGHFVGDNAQPFHLTSNYDGYSNGHGGIHSYYEEASVSELGSALHRQIVTKARDSKKREHLAPKTVLEKMRALAEMTYPDMEAILKQDPIKKKSTIKLEKGMTFKTPAERRPAKVGAEHFQPLITNQMARASLLLAHLWDQIYEQADKPNVTAYGSYKYPFQPDYVEPDYIKGAKKKKK